jgi:hypothetical protein
MSEITKNYRLKSRIFFWLGILLTFLPVIIFGISGCMNGSISMESKLKFGLTGAAAIILTVLGIKSKFNCRSITYILLFGCYFVVKKIEIVVLVAGICCILDEFVCRPLHRYYHEKAVINKEIDKRIDA